MRCHGCGLCGYGNDAPPPHDCDDVRAQGWRQLEEEVVMLRQARSDLVTEVERWVDRIKKLEGQLIKITAIAGGDFAGPEAAQRVIRALLGHMRDHPACGYWSQQNSDGSIDPRHDCYEAKRAVSAELAR